jgi:KDEL-tailed cysteine endopeptidase
MRASLLACGFGAAAAAADGVPPPTARCAEWARRHGRTYATPQEAAARCAVVEANLAVIDAHNAAAARDGSWLMGDNAFTDLTADEFRARVVGGGDGAVAAVAATAVEPQRPAGAAALPASVDWEARGAVTPVRDQGACGGCWAFSVAAALEGGLFLATNATPPPLSVQQLLDCGGGGHGCAGGSPQHGYDYWKGAGACADAAYPFLGHDAACRSSACARVATLAGWRGVTARNEDELLWAVVRQPVAVSIDASSSVFQHYRSGVLTSRECGTQLDHAVLLVGYGTDDGGAGGGGNTTYWRVKNSWGVGWGEKGYVRLARGAEYGGAGQCGILEMPTYPVGAAPATAAARAAAPAAAVAAGDDGGSPSLLERLGRRPPGD